MKIAPFHPISVFCYVLLLTFFTPGSTNGQLINTIAGTGAAGFTGDGGPALAATFDFSSYGDIATDKLGNIYIGDFINRRVRKINVSGIITTFAGDGSFGYGGDGGAATAAQLSGIMALATDTSGNLYVGDQFSQSIRKISTAGIISTIAGTSGSPGYSGDGGPATACRFAAPIALATDRHGNLFVADVSNYVVRKIDASGIITAFAGNGGYGSTGDGGPATAARLSAPMGVAVDSFDNVYVSDMDAHCIRRIDPSGTITTFAGTGTIGATGDGGPATAAKLFRSNGLAMCGNDLYISDYGNQRIRKVNIITGIINAVAGRMVGYGGDGGPATLAKLKNPCRLAFDTSGFLYVHDAGNNRTRIICPGLTHIPGTIAGYDTVCSGQTTALSTGITGGIWTSIDTTIATVSTTGVVTGIAVGSDTIRYVTTNRCGSDTATFIIQVIENSMCHTVVGSIGAKHKAYVSIAPNPNSGTFSFYLSSASSSDAQVTITNILGEKIRELKLPTNSNVTLRLDAPNGVYFIHTIAGSDNFATKIIIE